MMEKFYTAAQLARRWKKHRQQVSRGIAQGRIRTTIIAGQKMVAEKDAVQPEPLTPGPKKSKKSSAKLRKAS